MNRGVLLTALSGILYGTIGYFGTTLQEQGLPLRDVLFWRFLFSVVLMLILLPRFAKEVNSNIVRHLVTLFVFGAILYGGGTALYFEASKSIGTGLAMVIFFAYPIFVVMLSTLIHKTPLGRATLFSLVLIVVGCTLIAFGDGVSVDLDLWGIFLAVLSGVAYGFYVFWSRQASSSMSPLLATFAVCLGATFGYVIYMFAGDYDFYWPTTSSVWLLMGGFSLLGTVLPVLLLLAGMKYISANKASIISVLEPVTVLAVGALILREPVTALQFLGAVIILCSAIVVQLDKEKQH